jgi:hypothetical protein
VARAGSTATAGAGAATASAIPTATGSSSTTSASATTPRSICARRSRTSPAATAGAAARSSGSTTSTSSRPTCAPTARCAWRQWPPASPRLLGRHPRGVPARRRHLARRRDRDRGRPVQARDRAGLLPLRHRAGRQPGRGHDRRPLRLRARRAVRRLDRGRARQGPGLGRQDRGELPYIRDASGRPTAQLSSLDWPRSAGRTDQRTPRLRDDHRRQTPHVRSWRRARRTAACA